MQNKDIYPKWQMFLQLKVMSLQKFFVLFLSSLLNYMFMVNLYKSSGAHKNTIKLFLLRVFNPFKRVIIFPHKKHKACCKKYKALILK